MLVLRRRTLCLALAAIGFVPPLAGQAYVYPRLDAATGFHSMKFTFAGAREPATATENGSGLLASAGLGVGVSRQVSVDVVYRRALGRDWKFEVMTLGFAVRSRGRTGATLRFGIGGTAGEPVDPCPEPFVCPGPRQRWQGSFDVSIGAAHPVGTRVAVGPLLWWSQTVKGMPKYRSLGVGLQVGLF
jgi:hypothetical protein